MKQDEIIEMALLAGLEQDGEMWFSNTYKTDMDVHINHLEAFAKLVAAKEREACAKISDDADGYSRFVNQFISKRIRARGEA